MAAQAEIPWYHPDPRIGSSIADLILRRGDIAAQQGIGSAAIWGNAINQFGQIASQMLQQRQEQKTEQRKQQGISAALASWDGQDAMALYRAVAPFAGATGAMQLTKSMIDFRDLGTKGDEREQERLGNTLGMVELMSDEDIARGYPALRQKAASIGMPVDQWPEQYSPELKPAMIRYGQLLRGEKPTEAKFQPVTTAEGIQPFDPSKGTLGPVLAQAVPKEVKPPATKDIGGRVMQFNPQTGAYDIPLGASEAALNRAAAAETRAVASAQKEADEAEKRAEKAASAEEARRANDDSVTAAFTAMEAALKNLEKYSKTAAITSPLAAANARQQYDDAASAFAATLSRATGDTRISDRDRAAYAGLMNYTGLGATALKVGRPDLIRERLTQAKNFFDEAAKGREKRRETTAPGDVTAGARRGTGTSKDPYIIE